MKPDIMILAAGFGSRMGELTKNIPKPLIKLNSKCLIDYSLDLVRRAGFSRVIVNTHYLGDLIQEYLGTGKKFDLEIVYSHEPDILGTGGAIKKARELFESEILVTLNSDSVFGQAFELSDVLDFHNKNLADVTLVLREESAGFSRVGVDENRAVVEFLEAKVGEAKQYQMYTGVQVMNTCILDDLPKEEKFCIARDFHVNQIVTKKKYFGYSYNGLWFDVGTPERLKQAEKCIN